MSIFFIPPVFGQEKEPNKIEIGAITFLFPSYEYNTGRRTIKLKAKYLEKIILSINDEEATYHIKKSRKLNTLSESFSSIGWILIGISLCSELGGGEFNKFVFLSGCGLTGTGLVLTIKSDMERLKSVERYNQAVEEKWGIFFQYLPKDNQLGLRLSHSF